MAYICPRQGLWYSVRAIEPELYTTIYYGSIQQQADKPLSEAWV
jgi:hypothetical protein